MAQPGVVKVEVKLDVTAARTQVRRLSAVVRDTLKELAVLDEALAQIEGREAALAHYGIRYVEVSS